MPGPTVQTIILNYRTPELSLRAAEAALREMAGMEGEIQIVDNDSRDGSFEIIAQGARAAGWNPGRVRLIRSARNGGYGAGNNLAIRAGLADGRAPDYVYVLNPDARPDAGAIARLVETLERDPTIGFAGSYLHGPDGEPHRTAFRFPTIRSEFEGAARLGPVSRLFANHVVARPIPEASCAVDWVAGASLMMRRSVLDEIGLFDEGFFLYFEETDLCRRARRAGWPTVYVRESEVTHEGSVSSGAKGWRRTPRYWFESRLRYFVKGHGAAYACAATGAHAFGGLIWRARRLVSRKPPADPPRFLRDLITHDLAAAARSWPPKRRPPDPGPRPAARGARP